MVMDKQSYGDVNEDNLYQPYSDRSTSFFWLARGYRICVGNNDMAVISSADDDPTMPGNSQLNYVSSY